MQLESMDTGIAVIAAIVFIGLVGVFVNPQKYQGVKWGIFFLLLAGAALGVNREYKRDAAAKAKEKKAEEAILLADKSSRLVEDGLLKQAENQQKFIQEKESLETAVETHKQKIKPAVELLIASTAKLEEIEEAALKAKKKDIAELVRETRLETSKELVQLAKKEEWISDKAFKKLGKQLKKKKVPLSLDDLKEIQLKMNEALSK